LRIEVIGEQAPTIRRTRLQLHSPAQGRDRFAPSVSLAARDSKLEMYGRGMRLLAGQRLEYLERQLSLAGDATGGPENQARMRMARNRLEDLTRLLGGKRSIPLQQSGSMPQRNIQCSNGLRNAVQLNIQSIPADFLSCYMKLPRPLCQIYNRLSRPTIQV
jgi:hypothetical protein